MDQPIHAFHYPIKLDAGLGRLGEESDYDTYITQLIKQVLLTSPGERINRPDFGAGLNRMVFEPSSEASTTLLQTKVFQSLKQWLGNLITVDTVTVKFGEAVLDVTIVYTVRQRKTKRYLNLEVTI
jgi:uncharacterized protein